MVNLIILVLYCNCSAFSALDFNLVLILDNEV